VKCPKCHYLSFEPEPRCRNCGYDLTFEPGDLLVRREEDAEQTPPDLELTLRDEPATSVASASEADVMSAPAARDRGARVAPALSTARTAPPVSSAPAAPAPEVSVELPLFLQDLAPRDAAAEAPEISFAPAAPEIPVARSHSKAPAVSSDELNLILPRAPRPPLSVRRPTPAPGRVREKYQSSRPTRQMGLLERDVLENVEIHQAPALTERDIIVIDRPDHTEQSVSDDTTVLPTASAGRRLEAALVDLVFIGAINAAIVWLTLQRCDLTFSQLGQLPMLPLGAMLLLLNSLYLLMFTATNGQTVGKMAAGIRVVAADDGPLSNRVTLRQAAVRALLTFPSVLALGAGFFPALFGTGLSLHDRLAHTRVVRA